ncbi:MAG TPA: tetratricopeptide repeat protein [Vicinamibacterales bacterium]
MRMSRLALVAAAVGLALMAGCAPALAPAPLVTAPSYPDFVFPSTPASLADRDLSAHQQRGWQLLQAGDIRGARHEFTAALKVNTGFYPAEAGLAYASLADRDYGDAVARFDRVLRRAAGYAPALVGRGDALVGAGRLDEATRSFQEALTADSSLSDVRRRLDVLAFRTQQQVLQAARQAAESGRLDEAAAGYERAIAGSLDSALLYRELAGIERRQGKSDPALAHLRKAIALDPGDARALVQLGDLLEERGDFAGAADAYGKADGLDPGEATRARLAGVRARADLARLPEEYKLIANAPQVTRGELAALVGVRLGPLLKSGARQEGVVVTDARNHWAAPWIMAVVRAGVMEPYPNHSFAPRGVVRRLDLARVASRVLSLIAVRRPTLARQWKSARPRIADLPPGHLGYPAAAMVVGADVMSLLDGATFGPTRPVTGSEAVDVVTRLEVLAR